MIWREFCTMPCFRKNLRAAVSVVILLALWGVISGFRLVDEIILPSPLSVLRAAPAMFTEGGLLVDLRYTLTRVCVAILIASLIGIPLGIFLGYRRGLYSFVEAPLHALRSVPATALFPLLLIVVGVGEMSLIVLAAYPSLLIIVVNGAAGVRLANQRRIYQASVLELNTFELITEVLFYEALPSIFDGIRTAVSYSLALVIAAEMFIGVGDYGLGRKIYNYQAAYRIPETYASIIITGGIGVLFNEVLTVVERTMLRWVPEAQHDS